MLRHSKGETPMNRVRITVHVQNPITIIVDTEEIEDVTTLAEKLQDPRSEMYNRFWEYLYDGIEIQHVMVSKTQ